MAKTVTSCLEDGVYEELREAAVVDGRSPSMLIETASLARLMEAQFVSDETMIEVLSEHALLRKQDTNSH